MTDCPLAYFLTWTTYGTWLPGDDRGWVKWHVGVQEPTRALLEFSTRAIVDSAMRLGPAARELADATIMRHCEIRSWTQHA
jgi:hypothetical protein